MERLNKKKFLVPDSILSMAAVHIKVHNTTERREYQMRISDCNGAIKLWGSIDSNEALEEGIEKMDSIISAAMELKDYLVTLKEQRNEQSGF